MKAIWNSKLVRLGLLTGVLGALNAIQPLIEDPKVVSLIASGIGVLTIILRTFFTYQPIARSPFIRDEPGD